MTNFTCSHYNAEAGTYGTCKSGHVQMPACRPINESYAKDAKPMCLMDESDPRFTVNFNPVTGLPRRSNYHAI